MVRRALASLLIHWPGPTKASATRERIVWLSIAAMKADGLVGIWRWDVGATKARLRQLSRVEGRSVAPAGGTRGGISVNPKSLVVRCPLLAGDKDETAEPRPRRQVAVWAMSRRISRRWNARRSGSWVGALLKPALGIRNYDIILGRGWRDKAKSYEQRRGHLSCTSRQRPDRVGVLPARLTPRPVVERSGAFTVAEETHRAPPSGR